MAELVHRELQSEAFTSEMLAMLVLAIPILAICCCETALCLLTISLFSSCFSRWILDMKQCLVVQS